MALAKSFYLPFRSRHVSTPSTVLWCPLNGTKFAFTAGINRDGTYPTAVPSGTNPRTVTSAGVWDGSASESVDGVTAICLKTGSTFELLRVATITEGDECILQYHYTSDSTLGGPIVVPV